MNQPHLSHRPQSHFVKRRERRRRRSSRFLQLHFAAGCCPDDDLFHSPAANIPHSSFSRRLNIGSTSPVLLWMNQAVKKQPNSWDLLRWDLPRAPWQMSVRVAPSTMNSGRLQNSCWVHTKQQMDKVGWLFFPFDIFLLFFFTCQLQDCITTEPSCIKLGGDGPGAREPITFLCGSSERGWVRNCFIIILILQDFPFPPLTFLNCTGNISYIIDDEYDCGQFAFWSR